MERATEYHSRWRRLKTQPHNKTDLQLKTTNIFLLAVFIKKASKLKTDDGPAGSESKCAKLLKAQDG